MPESEAQAVLLNVVEDNFSILVRVIVCISLLHIETGVILRMSHFGRSIRRIRRIKIRGTKSERWDIVRQ